MGVRGGTQELEPVGNRVWPPIHDMLKKAKLVLFS